MADPRYYEPVFKDNSENNQNSPYADFFSFSEKPFL